MSDQILELVRQMPDRAVARFLGVSFSRVYRCRTRAGIPPFRPAKGRRPKGKAEPTMAELDALEAEQRKCLPDWWWTEVAKLPSFAGGDEEQ